MRPYTLDWFSMLQRVKIHSHRIEVLQSKWQTGAITIEAFFVDLLRSGFTLREANELFLLLRR
jgi:hypothetical protein